VDAVASLLETYAISSPPASEIEDLLLNGARGTGKSVLTLSVMQQMLSPVAAEVA